MRVWRTRPLARFRADGLFNVAVVGLWFLAVSTAAASGRRPPDIRQADFNGLAYLALEDVAAAMGGHLRWYPVSERVDLTIPSHEIQFSLTSDKAIVDGQSTPMGGTIQKDSRATWVPRSFFTYGPLAKNFDKRIDLGPGRAEDKPPLAKPDAKDKSVAGVPPANGLGSDADSDEEDDAEEEAAAPPAPVPATLSAVHAIRRIVIDPGHGGKDPGALGSRGTEEKNVNLWMANELADTLRAKDFEVLLTRTDDSFIPLASRSALANKYKADLFISVHCNASLSSKLRGFETYVLSEKASDPHADAVARQENASLEFEGKTVPNSVQAVLRSLTKNANINRSAQLAGILDRTVAAKLSQTGLGVKQAAFYVLRGTEMPAILIELGFLTNRAEEKQLRSRGYRERMVNAIESSILEYDRKQREGRKKG